MAWTCWRWNENDRLVGFTVMVRPMRGLTKLVELMQRQLTGNEAGSQA